VSSLKHKISIYSTRAQQVFASFSFKKRSSRISQLDIDKKLVYSLSPRKIPSSRQFKHLHRFLNPKENLVIKICGILVIINLVYLGIVYFKKHIQLTPAVGGIYTEAMVGYPKLVNPLYAASRDVDNDLSRLIYSSLFKYNTNGEIVQDLVENYQISEDKKEYLITIKDKVKWHNGEILTVDDIIFTINLIKDETYRSPLRAELSGVNTEKIDDRTVKLILPEPYAPFLEMLTFGIMPKNIWETIGADAAGLTDLNLKPIGSGPYKFKSLVKSKSGDLKEYHLEVNTEYYNQVAYIKSLNFKFFPDYIEAIKSFNSNQVDGLSYLPFDQRPELLKKDSANIFDLIRPQIVGIFFNQTKNKSLENKDLRIALAKAINKTQILNDIFAGVYKDADSPILKTNFAYNNSITKYNYAPEESRAILKDKTFKIVLTVIDLNSNVAIADKIKTDWATVGMEVELKIIPLEQASNIIKNRDFEALLYGQSVGGDPDVFAFWHSTQTGAKGLNIAGYNNAEVDKLLTEARVDIVVEGRKEKYNRFQEIITAEVPAIFLYSPTYTYVQSKKIKGFDGQAAIEPADRLSNISNWYIKTNKKLTW
jgi:peptide/nickel transport system substrate-binding protein